MTLAKAAAEQAMQSYQLACHTLQTEPLSSLHPRGLRLHANGSSLLSWP